MDREIGKGRLSSFSLDTDITLASRRRSFQNICRTDAATLTPTYYVESPWSQKRAFGGHEIVGGLSAKGFRPAAAYLKVYPHLDRPHFFPAPR